MQKHLTSVLFLIGCISAPLSQGASFTLIEQAHVRNDRTEMTFSAEVQHTSKKAVQEDAKALTDWGYSYRTTYPEIGISVMSQKPARRCIDDCKRRVWAVKANVRLYSDEVKRLGQMSALLLERFKLERIRFGLSPSTRAKAEHMLIRRAVERFTSEVPDGESYDSIEITSKNTARPLSEITHTETDALDTGYTIIAVTLSRN